jgi:hypothetical protein
LSLCLDHSFGLVLTLGNLELKYPGSIFVPPKRKVALDSNHCRYGIRLLFLNTSGSLSLVVSSLCGVSGSSHTYLRGEAFGKSKCLVDPHGIGENSSILGLLFIHISRLL